MSSTITESLTLVTLVVRAVARVATAQVFARDPYESRRTALPGPRLLAALVLYQFTKDPTQAGLRRVVEESPAAQELLGGTLARNTLANALTQRDLDQMIEAWLLVLTQYRPFLTRCGKKFARLAAVDASLLKLSLAAFDWARYRQKSGAAKITCVFEWVRGVPQQFVFSAAAKAHDLVAAQQLKWSAHWTYLFDRGYFSFPFLTTIINARAHFVIRLKVGVHYQIVQRHVVPSVKLPAGIKALTSDWTVRLPGWEPDLLLRLVSYQLTDGKLLRVLTTRHDLRALSIAQLYKERWTIENWWRWRTRIYKVQEPLGRSANALPLQIVAAFVTDLVLRACKHSGGFRGSLYEFVTLCRDLALVPLAQLKSLRHVFLTAASILEISLTDSPLTT